MVSPIYAFPYYMGTVSTSIAQPWEQTSQIKSTPSNNYTNYKHDGAKEEENK